MTFHEPLSQEREGGGMEAEVCVVMRVEGARKVAMCAGGNDTVRAGWMIEGARIGSCTRI